MENKRIWAILVVALFGGNLTGLTGIIGNQNTKTGHEDLQRQLDEIKLADSILEEKYHDHRHEAPPRWVQEKLLELEREIIELRRMQ